MRSLFVALYIPIVLSQYLGGYGMGYPYNDLMYQQQMMGMYGMGGYGMYNPYLMGGYGMQYDPASSGYGLLGLGNNMGLGMSGNQMGGLGTNMLNNGNTMRRRISSSGQSSTSFLRKTAGGCNSNSGWLDRAKSKKV